MVKKLFALFISFGLIFFLPITSTASALSRSDLKYYAQNNIMFIDDSNSLLADCLNGELVNLGDNSKTALNYLIQRGYSKTSAAAIVGNLIAESGVVPNKIEGGAIINDTSWRLTNWEKFGKRGFGIAQWTDTTRQTNLQNFADENSLPVTSIEAQLAFLFKELDTGVRGARTKIENMNSKSFEEATFIIYRFYETPRSSFCTTNDKAGCYNNIRPMAYSDLSPTETQSAYTAFANRLKLARSALAEIGDIAELSSGTTPISNLTCAGIAAGSAAANKIVEIAKQISWPSADGTCDSLFGPIAWKTRASGGVSACSATLSSVGKLAQQAVGGLSLRDCGKFVGAVMIYGQIDTDFPKVGVRSQMAYMNSSQKWTKVSTDGQEFPMTSLQPGDVLAYSAGTGDATAGHIQIWIGDQSVVGKACPNGTCKVNIASASYTTWTPSLNLLTRMSSTYKGTKYPLSVYRLASDPNTNIATNDIVKEENL